MVSRLSSSSERNTIVVIMKTNSSTLSTTVLVGSIVLLSSLLMAFMPKTEEETGKVSLVFSNVKTSKGNLILGLYKDHASFKKEEPYKMISIPKDNYNQKQVKAEITLPKGTYGIAMLDDENNNAKMDYSFGFPKEGFGFSNYYHKGWSRPDFSKFDFYHNGQHSTVKITVQYF
jgi:uncharacterized protein (DUF2141 family)